MRKKTELTDEEVLRLLSEGWHFHTKKVTKYTYMTCRKGQDTKSFGALDEETWKRIKNLEQQQEKKLWERGYNSTKEKNHDLDEWRRARTNTMNRLYRKGVEELSLYRGIFMQIDCKFKDNEFCTQWALHEKIPLFKHLDNYHKFFGETRADYAKKTEDDEGKTVWLIRATSFFCQNCSTYEPSSA
jgi:hypothetical protein